MESMWSSRVAQSTVNNFFLLVSVFGVALVYPPLSIKQYRALSLKDTKTEGEFDVRNVL